MEKALGANHPDVAQSLNNLAALHENQGRYAEAEPLYKRALAIQEETLGPDHPHVAILLSNLAVLYRNQGRYAEAIKAIRRASTIYRDRAARSGSDRSGAGVSEQKTVRLAFLRHADIAHGVLEQDPAQRPAMTAEGFEAGQLAQVTSAAAAVARMAARFGAGDDTLAGVVRARQVAAERWLRLDKALIAALSQ